MKVIRDLIPYLSRYKGKITLSIVSNILLSIFTVFSIPLIIPFFQILFERTPNVPEIPSSQWDIAGRLNYFFSNLIIELDKQQALLYICLFIVVVFLFKNLFRYLALYFLAPARNSIIRDIRNEILLKYLNLPLSFFTTSKQGDLISRMSNDVYEIEVSILNVIEAIFKAPLIILGSLGFMLYISPRLTLFVFVLLVITGFVIGGISKTLKKQSHDAQNQLGKIISTTEETISGIRIIKSFGAEEKQAERFNLENTKYKNILTRILWRRDLSSPVSEFLGITVVAVLLYYGSTLVFNDQLGAETFFAFIFAFYQVIEPSKMFSSAYYNMQKGAAAFERIQHILALDTEMNKFTGTKKITKLEKSITLRNIFFSFKGSAVPILKNIDLTIPKGKHIAIVGASGSGKTTLVNLLPRFYDAEKGEILIDDTSITQYHLASLRSLFGIVSQEPVLFHDTIRNNIAFGQEDIAEEQIIAAAKIANAHDFIMEQPNGYDTIVGDKGAKLSGGQRQRITIARAILKDPSVLILDEATSALDAESEYAVKEALQKAMKNRTVLTIAHKFSTIQNADEIIVMKDGEIIQRGNHEDLIKMGGDYLNNLILQKV